MSGIMVIDNYAFRVEGNPSDNADENVMFAMFTFDRLRNEPVPRQFQSTITDKSDWWLFLLEHISAYFGVDQKAVLKDWADYNRPLPIP